MSIHVHLPDGKALELPDGSTGTDAAAAIGPGLARAALAIEVGGELRDLARPLEDGDRIAIVTRSSGPQALELIRHDAAHVLAAAVTELYPGVKISIGPPIEQGFYYDFEFPDGVALSQDDFPAIEARMREHIKVGEAFVREDVPVAEARARFAAGDQDYKVELIDDLVAAAPAGEPLETVSLYTNGPFTDLCRGPHAPSTNTVRAFTLQSLAGAYWRGDSDRTMLTRVYGTAFFSKDDLAQHLERLEQARARDHRKLGRELDLFHFNELSPGSAFWLPHGTTLFNTLVGVSRELTAKHGYDEVKTPQLYDAELWRISGHWDKYRENMFITESEDRQMAIKPMNCPGHFLLYKSQRHSYRDLPVRYAEPGLLHRNERSGTLHGLLRVRHFIQDDAHIMCTEDQIQDEVAGCLEMGFEIYRMFGFTPELELSTRPENRLGDDALWDRAEGELIRALESRGMPYKVNEGDGAFYGPKIDLHMTDAIGRSWQLGTVQLDYGNPERFDMTYTGADNAEHRPVVIHRALMGSLERFIGIITEHYAGDFPVWLTPVQAIVLPISDRLAPPADGVLAALRAAGIRAEIDDRTESIGRKIRDAELRKIPYMLVVGEREAADGTVAVRERHHEASTGSGSGPVIASMPVSELVARIAAESRARSG